MLRETGKIECEVVFLFLLANVVDAGIPSLPQEAELPLSFSHPRTDAETLSLEFHVLPPAWGVSQSSDPGMSRESSVVGVRG